MIRYDKGEDKEFIYEMWQRNFQDPVEYAQFYFQEVYGKNQILLCEEEDCVKGMLHHNPYTLHTCGQDFEANYIVGVATDEEYRRQGIMRKLLRASFQDLRDQGDMLTYLMPADERYYLPFGFRFGMNIIEQEVHYQGINLEPKANYRFLTHNELADQLAEIAEKDNAGRSSRYVIHTKIDQLYLERMQAEAKSDFARVLYVFDEETYLGRCIVGAEDIYMTISQINLAKDTDIADFLSQIMAYCEKLYHFGYYRIYAQEDFLDSILGLKERYGFRLIYRRIKPTIMFRILNLEKVAMLFKGRKEDRICLQITDSDIPDQEGIYLFDISQSQSAIRKIREEEVQDYKVEDTLSIAELTQILFHRSEQEGNWEELALSDRGKEFLLNIVPVDPICITEIV